MADGWTTGVDAGPARLEAERPCILATYRRGRLGADEATARLLGLALTRRHEQRLWESLDPRAVPRG